MCFMPGAEILSQQSKPKAWRFEQFLRRLKPKSVTSVLEIYADSNDDPCEEMTSIHLLFTLVCSRMHISYQQKEKPSNEITN